MRSSVFALTLVSTLTLVACSSQSKKANDSAPTAETATTRSAPAQKFDASGSEPPIADLGEAGTSPTAGLTEEKEVVCKKKEDERLLDIEPFAENGCKLWYTKNIGRKAVAWSSSSKTHCNTALDKMIDNLEKDGFECK